MQQGSDPWTTPGGENNHELARNVEGPASPTYSPGYQASRDAMRADPGARRMTPGERIHHMGVPMQTGIITHEKDSAGMSQKQKLQETVSAGDDWWAGDTIDLSSDPNALPRDWSEEVVPTSGHKVYRNKVTGMVTRTRPKREQEGTASWITGVAGNGNEEDKRLLNSVFPPLDDVGVGCGALESVKFEQMTQAETLMRGNLDAGIDHVGSGTYSSDEDQDQTRTLMREILRQENGDTTDSVIKTILHDVADLEMNALLSERGESVSGVSKEADLTDAESAPAVGTNTMLRRIREGEPLEAGGGLAPILGISAEGVAIEEVGDADDEYAITDIRSMYASDSTQVKRHHVVCVRTHTSNYTLIYIYIYIYIYNTYIYIILEKQTGSRKGAKQKHRTVPSNFCDYSLNQSAHIRITSYTLR